MFQIQVGQPRDITTKRGKQIQKCDVQIFDETCHSFPMTLYVHNKLFSNTSRVQSHVDISFSCRWDENIIEMAISWTPGETGWENFTNNYQYLTLAVS